TSAEPDVGRAQAQVHVVGNDRAAIGGKCAGHRKVVAPRKVLGRQRRPTKASLPPSGREGDHLQSGWWSEGRRGCHDKRPTDASLPPSGREGDHLRSGWWS